MARAEAPQFHNPWDRLNHTFHDAAAAIGRNRLMRVAGSLALALAAGAGINYFISQENAPQIGVPVAQPLVPAAGIIPGPEIGSSPILVPDPTWTATREATKTPSPTATTTATATATSTATPTPKEVTWTIEQITTTQEEALQNQHLLLLDTWSYHNANISEAVSSKGLPVMVLNGFNKGDNLKAPIGGTISSIATGVGDNYKVRDIYISNRQTEVIVTINMSNQPLVKVGDKIDVNASIVQLSGDLLPAQLQTSKIAQVRIAQRTSINKKANYDISMKNILKDENGVTVKAPSYAGK